AAEQRAVPKLFHQRIDAVIAPRDGAIDPLSRKQNAALEAETMAKGAQRLAQLPEIRQRGELVEGGNLVGHELRSIRRLFSGKPCKSRIGLWYASIGEPLVNMSCKPTFLGRPQQGREK